MPKPRPIADGIASPGDVVYALTETVDGYPGRVIQIFAWKPDAMKAADKRRESMPPGYYIEVQLWTLS